MGEYYGFNTRRKRNLDLGGAKKTLLAPTEESWNQGELEEGYEEIELENDEIEIEEDNEEIELENEEIELENDEMELEEDYEEIELENDDYEMKVEKENAQIDAINITSSQQNNQMFIDGKPFVPKQIQKKQSFNETHVRITTYLEKNLHQIIHMLLEQGQIESISKFVNDSIKEHLLSQYNNEN